MSETQAVEVYEPQPQGMTLAKAAQVMSIVDVQATAKAIVTSRLIAGVENESQAIVKILAGQELGLGPIAAVNGLYVLNGRVGMMASVAGALLQKHGYTWQAVWDDVDNPTACEITFFGVTLPPSGWTNRFTVSDAIRAGLIKQGGAHQKYPKDMLFNRCFMAGSRKVAPAVLLNMGYEYDELREATMPAHLQADAPKPAAAAKPAAATLTSIPAVQVDEIECPLHPGVMAKLNKWGTAYSHPTAAKNADGKTVWCNNKIKKETAAPADDSQPPNKPPTEASEQPKSTESEGAPDYSAMTQSDYFKELDNIILDKGLTGAKVREILKPFGYTKRTEITLAKRGEVLKSLQEG